jgi:hypothetical protein
VTHDEIVDRARGIWQEAVYQTSDHTFLCRSGCSLTGGVVCSEGLALKAADGHAWNQFYEVRGPDPESEAAA